MQNRIWIVYFKKMLAASLAAYVLSVAAVYFFNDAEFSDAVRDGIGGVALYIAASIIISIVGFFGGLLYLWADKGTDYEELALSDLRSRRLPPPEAYHPRTAQYLSELAQDPDVEPNDRVNAATLAATFAMTQKHLGFFAGVVFATAADRAVARYSNEAPRKRREEANRDEEEIEESDWDYD